MLWFSCIAIVSCSEMMTTPKLAQTRFYVRHSWSYPWAIAVVEPISAPLVSAILFSVPELPVSRETAITNSPGDLSHIICDFSIIFSQICYGVAGP